MLQVRTSEVLLLLHQPENIELWDRRDPMTAFWDISGQVRGLEHAGWVVRCTVW